MTSMFLQSVEVRELTGVCTGKRGKTRETLQIEALRKMKIQHYVNAAGRPVVARAVIEGGGFTPKDLGSWEPAAT